MSVPAALLETIGARAAEIEEARRLPADLARAMAAEGLFRMALPAALGGGEWPATRIVAALEELAAADASAGWCLMIGVTTSISFALMDPDLARPWLADPLAISGGVFAPMGRAVAAGDGWRVSGRWSWASGSTHCAQLFGGCLLVDDGVVRLLPDGRPDARMLLMPASALTLHDSWHAAGLKGTGSGDMEAVDVPVPAGHAISLTEDRPRHDGPLYRFPIFGLLALGIAGVASGNARAALETAKSALAARRPQGSTRPAAERATVQAEIATTQARLGAARAWMFESIEAAWAEAATLGAVPLATRARLRLAATHMVRTAADSTRACYDLGGGAALYLDNPLQRRFRDAHAMTQHAMVQPQTLELAGRVLMGLPTADHFL